MSQKMRDKGIRVELTGGMSIGKAIRNAEKAKMPIMCIVGAREAEAGTLSVRTYADGELGVMSAEQVIEAVATAAAGRADLSF